MKKTVLITDLDNTLFDWVDLWVQCFGGMLEKIIKISGVDPSVIKQQIRDVHQKHGTSEYFFLIEELPALQLLYPGQELTTVFSAAIDEYRARRRKHLALYPTVAETLLKIKGSGARIVAYTESMAFYTNYRVRRLGLDGVIDLLYSPVDHDFPTHLAPEQLRKYPVSHYSLRYTKHLSLPPGSTKPDPAVLESIVEQLGVSKSACIYVGDSLLKDVAMAQDAGVADVWAKYGRASHRPEYELLREVTHWTQIDVERERRMQERDISPTIVLDTSYSQLLSIFEFGAPDGSAASKSDH